MNLLFIHQNFPGQFKHLAPALVQQGHQVTAMTLQTPGVADWQGVRLVPYSVTRGTTKGIHPWVSDFETKTIRAEACFRAALKLKASGFQPDALIAHPGWGESLFLKEVWPAAKLGLYSEFFYHPQGADVGFDPEFPPQDPGDVCRLRLKNLNNLLHFETADAGISPTHWQASTYPEPFRSRIRVIHDGIDTDALVPNPQVQLTLTPASATPISLTRADEVITFVNRNLEPYRGYHRFMRALPALLQRRPKARVLIVGGDDVSYGARPDTARYGPKTWRQIFIDEVRPTPAPSTGPLTGDRPRFIPDVGGGTSGTSATRDRPGVISDHDWSRVHFLGKLPYPQFIALLQLSSVHVYLTYPFVLSWSLLEAMSLGCAIIASDTQPLHEAIQHDETGRLVDFFDTAALTDAICDLLDDPASRARLGANARTFAQTTYDLKRVCLPQQLAWVEALTA